MSTAYWCVFVAACFPYVFTALAKLSPTFDNRRPREYLDMLDGWRKRAHWVQVNSFVAFPAFAAAVIIAHLGAPHSLATINLLAVTFIFARVLYGICYLADLPGLRTVVWGVGFGCVVWLFLISMTSISA